MNVRQRDDIQRSKQHMKKTRLIAFKPSQATGRSAPPRHRRNSLTQPVCSFLPCIQWASASLFSSLSLIFLIFLSCFMTSRIFLFFVIFKHFHAFIISSSFCMVFLLFQYLQSCLIICFHSRPSFSITFLHFPPFHDFLIIFIAFNHFHSFQSFSTIFHRFPCSPSSSSCVHHVSPLSISIIFYYNFPSFYYLSIIGETFFTSFQELFSIFFVDPYSFYF